MDKKIPLAKHFLDYELKDDETPYGGTAFLGETLGDFIEDLEYFDEDTPMDKINEALKECGIKPIPFA